jgi:hypothetical protein
MRELATEMTRDVGYNCGFNAALAPAGVGGVDDVSHLQLVDNGEEYECVCEVPEDAPLYDIWERGQLLRPGLDIEQAARFLLNAYLEAKLRRVKARWN